MVDGVVTIDETGIVQSFNAAAEKIFGYTEAEVLGKNVTGLMSEPDRRAHGKYLERYVTTGRSKILDVGPREVVGIDKDGATIPLELAIGEATLKGERRFIGALREISERKQMEVMLRQAADGPHGVTQVESGDFDLVLCDVLLPGGLTANDIADKVAAARPDTPLLFMSGYTANTIVENGKIHPDIAFMPKPFTRSVLARRVRDLLDRVSDAQG
jgi:PAS domain S-box-containing protein